MAKTSAAVRKPMFLWLAAAALTAAPAVGLEDPTYRALRDARPDGRVLEITQPLILERDAFRFRLESGALHFLSPVAERTVGAVFVGRGGFELHPATGDERRHLAFVTGEDDLEVLADRFDSLVLLFTDGTAAELERRGPFLTRPVERAAVDAYEDYLRHQRKDFELNVHLRLLQDLLNSPEAEEGAFFAYFDGDRTPPALAVLDPRGAEALDLGSLLGGEDTLLYTTDAVKSGLWYLSHRRSEVESGRTTPYRPTVDALHYTIDTEIRRNEDLAATAVIRLRAREPVRVVPFRLLSTLRIEEAACRRPGEDGWVQVAFIQEEKREDADPAVVLPEILPPGSEVEIRLSYRGDEVVEDLGFDTYAVLARTSWYPAVGVFRDPATYDLTYRLPKRLDLISVGRRVRHEEDGDGQVSVWKVEEPVRVVGFNYGRFTQVTDRDEVSGLRFKIYTNARVLSFRGRSARSEIADAVVNPGDLAGPIVDNTLGPQTGGGDPRRLAEAVAVDGINAARLFHTYFGPLPEAEIALTQQPFFFHGQAWPGLVFLPHTAFMTGTGRNTIGLTYAQDFVEAVGYHEVAHQWWGHLVGWKSYRDQWLSEGFATFSAALALQYTQGWEEYGRFWKEARDRIASKLASPIPVHEVGPIHRGYRLDTAKSEAAYSILVYDKGAFVLHMLRMLMWDAASPEPDRRFIAMMRDFVSTYAGGAPSTADFQEVVERHMLPAMNATGDGKMDWFFDQWVYGTELPTLRADLDAAKAGKGAYRITGEVTLADVSADFRALVPLWIDFGKGEMARVGVLPFVGPGTRAVDVQVNLPRKPRRVLANARWEVLARDR